MFWQNCRNTALMLSLRVPLTDWGLRSYKAPPLLWDDHNDCEHEWGSELTAGRIGKGWSTGERTISANAPSARYDTKFTNRNASNFCLKCNAWRGQLGSEPDPDLFIKHLCDIFDLCKRVLKKTGSLWVNLDDSFAGGKGQSGCRESSFQDARFIGGESLNKGYTNVGGQGITRPSGGNFGVPAKSLCAIPERFVLEMLKRGWIRRNTIIWQKPSCMPESVKDRCTIDFEYLYFFTQTDDTTWWVNQKTKQMVDYQPLGIKGEWDKDWIYRQDTDGELSRKRISLWSGVDYFFERQFDTYTQPLDRWGGDTLIANGQSSWDEGTGQTTYRDRNMRPNSLGRNKRSVWVINPQPQKQAKKGQVAHYAAFPEALCTTPILATVPEQICTKCGKPRVKVYEEKPMQIKRSGYAEESGIRIMSSGTMVAPNEVKEIGLSDCGCGEKFVPGVILDPFAGTGTTAVEARKLGRKAILIEVSSEYAKIIQSRLEKIPLPMEVGNV